MTYVVDGYNLMYALGLLTRQVGPGGLPAARAEFLAWLGRRLGDAAGDVIVVFDARHVPGRVLKEEPSHGLHVVFALRQEADDLIEELIRGASAPKQLTAISNDHRIRQAARRRGCIDWDCGRFLDWLDQRSAIPRPRPVTETIKPDPAGDSDEWLREFADLKDDPAWRELFDEPDFGDDQEE